MQKWAKMLMKTGKAFVDPLAMTTNERGLIFLEFATLNDRLVITKHPDDGPCLVIPNRQHHNQIDYILVRKCFRSGVNIARTQSFPGADIRSDNVLLMVTFHLRLKRISKPKHTRLKFGLEKLKDPGVFETFQDMIGLKFAPLTVINN